MYQWITNIVTMKMFDMKSGYIGVLDVLRLLGPEQQQKAKVLFRTDPGPVLRISGQLSNSPFMPKP